MKQKELSLWLKLIIILCGCFGLLFCIYIGPETGKAVLLVSENLKGLYKPFVLFIWITGIPFFSALFLHWKTSRRSDYSGRGTDDNLGSASGHSNATTSTICTNDAKSVYAVFTASDANCTLRCASSWFIPH